MDMDNVVYLLRIGENDIVGALVRLLAKLKLPPQAEKIGIKINLSGSGRREAGGNYRPYGFGGSKTMLRGEYPRFRT